MQSNLTSQAFFSQFLTGAQAAHQLGLNLAAGLLWHQCGSCGWLFCCVILVFWDLFFFCNYYLMFVFMRVFFAFMLIGLMCWVGFSVVFLALWCALRCWRCLFLSLVILLFLSSPSSFQIFFPPPSPIHQSMSVYLIFGCWYFAHFPHQLSSPVLAPFSTPPAPSPNGPPSPKFGRDPLSYCLKEINKTVKPRISSFRTLRRSVSHHRRRFGCQETFTHKGLHIILCSCLCKSHWIPVMNNFIYIFRTWTCCIKLTVWFLMFMYIKM